MVTDGGSDAWISDMTWSISAVSSRVLAPGCFFTDKITADCPLYEALPRTGSTPTSTLPTIATVTGTPFTSFTTVAERSSAVRARPRPRTRYSCESSMWKPAAALALADSKAVTTSSIPTLCRANAAGSRLT